jgi:alkylation response protein AidB-like acyl-CoA dehydrogenase
VKTKPWEAICLLLLPLLSWRNRGGRIGFASQAVGSAQAAYETALECSKVRDSSAIRSPQIEVLLLCWLIWLSRLKRQGRLRIIMPWPLMTPGAPYTEEAANTKTFALGYGWAGAPGGHTDYGGPGYACEYPVERCHETQKSCRFIRVSTISSACG